MSGAKDSRRLSVALIVRDAAEALRETLASVHAIADEMVVLDTGSHDNSRAVATELGARVIHHPWKDDFSEARNACQQHLSGDWTLWLDAGEELAPDEATRLREFVMYEADAGKAYALLLQVPPNGPGAAGEQVARIRLVPRHPHIQYQGRVRESLTESLAANQIAIDGLPIPIHRGEREHDAETKRAKAQRNIRLCELEIREKGPSASLLNCLGDAFQTLDDHARALEFYRHALAASPRGSADMLEAYYGLITSLDVDEANRESQLSLCVKALEAFPMDAQLLCAMGGYLHTQGRPDLALKAYETAFRYGQVEPATWHVGEIRDIAAICFSIALQLEQRGEETRAVLQEALQANASSLRLRRHLMEFHIKRGERDLALAQLDQLPEETPHRDALRSAVRGACLAAQNNWIAAKAYLKTAYTAGCRDAICVRWLAVIHLVAGDRDEARRLLTEWLEREPGNPEALKYLQAADTPATPADEDRHLRIDDAASHGLAAPASQDLRRAPSDFELPFH